MLKIISQISTIDYHNLQYEYFDCKSATKKGNMYPNSWFFQIVLLDDDVKVLLMKMRWYWHTFKSKL